MSARTVAILGALAVAVVFLAAPSERVDAGQLPQAGYRVLAPISHDNLTIFPVVSSERHDTRSFLTLDEGVRSGEVIVTEAGQVQPLVRRRQPLPPQRPDRAEVNRLVLVNNSERPLILLAGEIVTGGKQDRVVGKDRIVPAGGEVALDVFCVEPGRWTASSHKFESMSSQMAQPSVRGRAMAKKDQQQVWDAVRESSSAMAAQAPAAAAAEIGATSSYARVMDNREVKRRVEEAAAPVLRSYEGLLRELRAQNAVGVVVAINGEIIWADLFASTQLLEKYWPKLVRSYAAEAVARLAKGRAPRVAAAQAFLDDLEGRREVVETEPGVFRHTEIVGDGFRAFELASLLPKSGFDVHVSKMAE